MYDITIKILDLVVTDEDIDLFTEPDVYVEFVVKRPQNGYHQARRTKKYLTLTLPNRPLGSNPHKGFTLTMVHFDPVRLDFAVMDSDWGPDKIMAEGFEILNPGINSGPIIVTVNGPAANITLEIEMTPSACGANRTYPIHHYEASWPPAGPLPVDLMVHVAEDEPADWLVIREYLPASVAFVFSEPMPDAIEEYDLDGEPAGQMLIWKLENPPGGEHFFHLVLEPLGPEPEFWGSALITEMEWLEADGDHITQYGGSTGFDDNIIGGYDDCDGNDLDDRAEIALDPTLDADGDQRLDICQGSFISTPDMTTTAGEIVVVPLNWELVQPGLEIRDFSFFVGFEAGAMEFLGPQTGGTLLGTDTWQAQWFMASDTHAVVYAYGDVPLDFSAGAPLIELPFFVNSPLVQQPPVRIIDFVFNELSTWTVPVSNGAIISGVKEAAGEGLQWEVRQSEGEVHVFFELPQAAEVTLCLWDITGKPLGALGTVQGVAGKNQLTTQLPAHLPSGIYVVEFRAGEERRSGRVKR